MFNINLINIYPQLVEINNEMNLLRIVDKKIKESLVIYYNRNENIYKVYMLNTMTGKEIHIKDCNGEDKLINLIENIKSIKNEINKLETLEKVENYILKTM